MGRTKEHKCWSIKTMVWITCIKFTKKAIAKCVQQQKQPYFSSNINQLSWRHTTMSFISFSLSAVDLFAAKIAGYTFV